MSFELGDMKKLLGFHLGLIMSKLSADGGINERSVGSLTSFYLAMNKPVVRVRLS